MNAVKILTGMVILLVATIVALLLILLLRGPVRAGDCYAVPITANTPTGIAGCERLGEGVASHYGPGNGVAMNFCTWTLRHEQGCGVVRIVSLDTGLDTVVPVVDFCDCHTGTDDERIVDLQWGVLDALGLDRAAGLYRVRVTREGASSATAPPPPPPLLPNTAMREAGSWTRASLPGLPRESLTWD